MKRNILIIFVFLAMSSVFYSCEVAQQLAKDLSVPIPTGVSPLTEGEVSQGLKRALQVGTDVAVSGLSAEGGFLSSAIYKIALPPEAKIITDNKENKLLKAVGISKLIEDVEISMNKAAEQAVIKAKPIFVQAITQMTLQDAFGILRGNDTSATAYLKSKTYQNLYNQFKPEVSNTLKQPVYNGMSTQKAWQDLTGAYNKVATYVPSWNKVNTQLDDYVTKKALVAVFEEIKKEEADIRKNPAARIDDILRRVFGS
jgi:hypothetical protein